MRKKIRSVVVILVIGGASLFGIVKIMMNANASIPPLRSPLAIATTTHEGEKPVREGTAITIGNHSIIYLHLLGGTMENAVQVLTACKKFEDDHRDLRVNRCQPIIEYGNGPNFQYTTGLLLDHEPR